MRIIWKISVLLILVITLINLGFSSIHPMLQTVKADSKVSGSTVGGFEVNSLKKDELKAMLNEEIKKWKESPILLEGNHTNLTLANEWFTFDVDSTVDEYFQLVEKPWFAFWEKAPIVHIPLQFTIQPALTNLIIENPQLNLEETIANIHESVGMLSMETIETVAIDLSIFESERIAFDLEEVKENTIGLSELVFVLNEQIIYSGQVFSLLERINMSGVPYNDGTADFVASLLYSVVLQTNFDIIERHSQGVVPAYLEPGIEADVDLGSEQDFQFVNNNEPAILKVRVEDSNLLIELFSIPTDTIAKHEVRDQEAIKPRTIYRYSSELKPGEEKLIQEGNPGLRVAVYRTIFEKKGPFEKEELISKDYYPPTHRVVLTSSQAQTIPIERDPDLIIDLNGDGLADMDKDENASNSTTNYLEEENVEYDKAGNIIKPE